MKKSDGVSDVAPAGAGDDLKAAVAGLLDRAAEREARDLAWLQAQLEPACELGRAALPVYAEMERQHGAWLRERQQELSPKKLNGSQWVVQIVEARQQIAEVLTLLDSPRTIERYLDEVRVMTPHYAGTGRVPEIIQELTTSTYGAARIPDLMLKVRDLVAKLKPRLEADDALAPLVSEPLVTESRAPRSRFARGPLSGRDA